MVSFGNAERFHGPNGDGSEYYLRQLEERLQNDRDGCVHVWSSGEIVGQIDMDVRELSGGEVGGYVGLYYLVPAYRGKGFGRVLDDYAIGVFKRRGLRVAQLSVSPSNMRAVRLYQRCGWRDLGERPGWPEVHLMEKRF